MKVANHIDPRLRKPLLLDASELMLVRPAKWESGRRWASPHVAPDKPTEATIALEIPICKLKMLLLYT